MGSLLWRKRGGCLGDTGTEDRKDRDGEGQQRHWKKRNTAGERKTEWKKGGRKCRKSHWKPQWLFTPPGTRDGTTGREDDPGPTFLHTLPPSAQLDSEVRWDLEGKTG